MELTKEFLIRKFNQFNKELFNGELPMIVLRISHGRKCQGAYHFKRNDDGTETPISITITNFYNRTKRQYENILIHEMIHYYLSYKNIGRYEDCHGYSFIKMMNKINSTTDYQITILANTSKLKSKDSLKKKEYTMLLFNLRGKKYISKVTGKLKNEKYIKENFSDVEIIKYITTTSTEAEKLINRTSRLSLIRATKENLKKYEIAA